VPVRGWEAADAGFLVIGDRRRSTAVGLLEVRGSGGFFGVPTGS